MDCTNLHKIPCLFVYPAGRMTGLIFTSYNDECRYQVRFPHCKCGHLVCILGDSIRRYQWLGVREPGQYGYSRAVADGTYKVVVVFREESATQVMYLFGIQDTLLHKEELGNVWYECR